MGDAAIRDSLETLCSNKEETTEKKDDSVKKAKPPVAASCTFPHKAKFVADETEAAGVTGRSSTMKPAQSFTQRGRMVNSGDTAWSAGCHIKHVGADKLGHETGEKEISSEAVEPGKEIVIELPLVAPDVEGEYWSYWRMQTADGTRFGDRVWVHCFVNNTESDGSANWVDIGEDNVESIAMEKLKVLTWLRHFRLLRKDRKLQERGEKYEKEGKKVWRMACQGILRVHYEQIENGERVVE